MHSVSSCSVFMFWSTGTRLAPPDVREVYCISCKCRTYTLLCYWQHVGVSSATFLPNGSDEKQPSGRIKADGWFESGWCVGALTHHGNWSGTTWRTQPGTDLTSKLYRSQIWWSISWSPINGGPARNVQNPEDPLQTSTPNVWLHMGNLRVADRRIYRRCID